MPRRVVQCQLPELVGLGFADEAGQRHCLDALHQHSPESYRALPGGFSVIFERKDLEWLEHYLERQEIQFTREPVVSIGRLSAEEAAELRSDRYERLLKSNFLNEDWLKAENKRLRAGLRDVKFS